MSTLMILRAKGDPTALEKYSADHPEVLAGIIEKAKSHGVLRHRFFGGDGEIIVVDEWPDQASFQRFFDASPEIAEMMASIGVTAPPDITFATEMSMGDNVG